MEIVISAHHFTIGGSESYVLTVAEQLGRFGHGVTLFTVEPGRSTQIARDRGLVPWHVDGRVDVRARSDGHLKRDACRSRSA